MAVLSICALFSSPSFALQVSTGPNGSNVQAVWDQGYTGQGVSVGLISQDNTRYTHEAFFDKNPDGTPTGSSHAHSYDATDQNNYVPSSHDTSVGCIICSRGGASYPNDKGTAPDAELYSFKVVRPLSGTDPNLVIDSSWIQNALDEARNNQCQVIVTGIQLSTTADGNTIWSLIYDYYAYQYNLVFATAAGNYASNITVFGDTYNSITTGGLLIDANDIYYKVGSSSNPGPTADGRRKPEVTAPSQNQWTCLAGSDTSWGNASPSSSGQTSWAVPHTGGVAAVLLSYANESPEPSDNRNEVIKAVIVNSAFPNILDKGGNDTIDKTNPNWMLQVEPWNEDRGYGRIDALRAYEILSSPKLTYSANKYQSVNTSTDQSVGWAYRIFNNVNIIDRYWIRGTQNNRLVLTMTWNRKVYSNMTSEANPMNLDMEIFDPQGAPVFSERLSDTDPPVFNNLRKADVLCKSNEYYEVRITSTEKKNEDRSYALAFELLPPLEADFNIDYVINELDLMDWAPYWLNTNCDNPLQPCYPYNLSDNNTINLSDFSAFAQKWLTYDGRYYTP